jgi:hypothetical protein
MSHTLKSHYTCLHCKQKKAATDAHFHPSSLDRAIRNPNILSIGKCKVCANEYSEQYRAAIKQKRLTRSRRTTVDLAHAKDGVLYVFGSGLPTHPYKIGITSGTDTRKRLSAVQTGNWVTITEIWKSDYTHRVDRIEKKLHEHFNNSRVSGEWFNLSKKDIKNIPALIQTFQSKL